MPDPSNWLRRFTSLRVDPDRGRGRAPHKPLLLLAVLDLFEAGLLTDGWVTLSLDLVVRFQNFWPIVQLRRGNTTTTPTTVSPSRRPRMRFSTWGYGAPPMIFTSW